MGTALFFVGVVGAVGCKKNGRVDSAREEARALTEKYREALQGELSSALQAGGPGAAVQVCNVEAPKIAARVAGAAGEDWTIQRTGFRVRNRANAPSEWQRRGLEALRDQIAAGASPAAAEWHDVVGGRLRYMRAIPLGEMCVLCHGAPQNIPQEVIDRVAELYPDDQAVGFSVGELRGAFVVTAPL